MLQVVSFLKNFFFLLSLYAVAHDIRYHVDGNCILVLMMDDGGNVGREDKKRHTRSFDGEGGIE